MITPPTPAQIAAAREAAQLTQQQAGELVHTDGRNWRRWEAGDRAINLAAWELFLIKTAAQAYAKASAEIHGEYSRLS